jgi:hypothetical protein
VRRDGTLADGNATADEAEQYSPDRDDHPPYEVIEFVESADARHRDFIQVRMRAI